MNDYNGDELLSIFESAGNVYSIPIQSIDKETGTNVDIELVPIYGLCRHASDSKTDSFGNMKSDEELATIDFQKKVKWISRGDNYSHTSISLNDNMSEMYSFSDDGFVEESIDDEHCWYNTESVYITVMFIEKEAFNNVKKVIDDFKQRMGDTRYNTASIIKQYISRHTVKNNSAMICSTFTGMILSVADPKNIHRDFTRLRPEDITILPRAFYVGNYKDSEEFYSHHQEFKTRVKSIYEEHKDELLDYNNHLPKLMLSQKFRELGRSDKIITWALDKFCQ